MTPLIEPLWLVGRTYGRMKGRTDIPNVMPPFRLNGEAQQWSKLKHTLWTHYWHTLPHWSVSKVSNRWIRISLWVYVIELLLVYRVAARALRQLQDGHIMVRHSLEQNVFSLCAKLRVFPLFEISTINQPLFRGWGPPVRGGIVIWLARALRALGARQHVIGLAFGWYCPYISFPSYTE